MIERKLPKAGILSIGSEITAGQVTDTNSSWISKQLKKHGIETLFHSTVPDNENLILSELNRLSEHCQLLFVTGGLGPTSDDFTRKIFSKWSQKPLKWCESSWSKVEKVLKKRTVIIRDIHKIQAYFPQGAELLENSNGTADGFSIKTNNKHNEEIQIWILPGPPREIQTIWQDHLEFFFTNFIDPPEKLQTEIWRTIGVPESEIATIAESILSPLNIEIGYRASPPYVEVKATFYANQITKLKNDFNKLSNKLKDVIISRNEDDPISEFIIQLKKLPAILIHDSCSQGYLLKRLNDFWLDPSCPPWCFTNSNLDNHLQNESFSHLFSIVPTESHSYLVSLKNNHQYLTQEFTLPSGQQASSIYGKKFLGERTLLYWQELLRKMHC